MYMSGEWDHVRWRTRNSEQQEAATSSNIRSLLLRVQRLIEVRLTLSCGPFKHLFFESQCTMIWLVRNMWPVMIKLANVIFIIILKETVWTLYVHNVHVCLHCSCSHIQISCPQKEQENLWALRFLWLSKCGRYFHRRFYHTMYDVVCMITFGQVAKLFIYLLTL